MQSPKDMSDLETSVSYRKLQLPGGQTSLPSPIKPGGGMTAATVNQAAKEFQISSAMLSTLEEQLELMQVSQLETEDAGSATKRREALEALRTSLKTVRNEAEVNKAIKDTEMSVIEAARKAGSCSDGCVKFLVKKAYNEEMGDLGASAIARLGVNTPLQWVPALLGDLPAEGEVTETVRVPDAGWPRVQQAISGWFDRFVSMWVNMVLWLTNPVRSTLLRCPEALWWNGWCTAGIFPILTAIKMKKVAQRVFFVVVVVVVVVVVGLFLFLGVKYSIQLCHVFAA